MQRTIEEERVFVTLTVADQLCGVPVLGVRDILGEHTITRIPLAPPKSPAASTCAAASSRRSTCAAPAAAAGTGGPAAHVGGGRDQGGELYALLVDQVSEVMSLKAGAFERNPPTLPPAWAQFSSGIYRLDGRLLGGSRCRQGCSR